MFQSCDSHVATGSVLDTSKIISRDQRLLVAIQEETGDICRLFIPENCDKTEIVCSEIAGSLKVCILGLF